MNVLFLSRLFYPHIGGVEKHVLEIGKILIQKGHSVTVVCERHDSGLTLTEKKDGIKICRIFVGKNNWFKKFRIWIELWKHLRFIKEADIVHCHDVFFWYFPFRFLFPFKKVFITFHGYENYPLKSKDILIHKISEKLSMGNICIGDFIKKWYGTKPTYTSYGGVGISNFPSSVGRQFPISSKTKAKSALFIGRLDEQTGIKMYVNAVKLVKKQISDFEFGIIGDGKFKKEIEKDFRVLGFQENPERYFSKYSFAFVSRYLSIMEAMAARKLVFAVYDNSLKEDYLRMTPFSKHILISGSVSDLVSKISFYLDNLKTQKKMIDEAYAWVKKYNWEEITNTYLKLWKV